MNCLRTSGIVLAVLVLSSATAGAQTPWEATVSVGTGTTKVFEFQTPTAASPQNEVVARFLVDQPAPAAAQDLTFTVEAHRGGYVLPADVVLGQTGQTLSDTMAATNQQAAFIEATLPALTADRQPVAGRVIEITVTFLPTHSFATADQGQTWSLRARRNVGPLPAEFSGFAAQGADAAALRTLVDRAKIEVSPGTLAFGETQINMDPEQVPLRPFTWANVGPGLFTPSGSLTVASPFRLFGAPAFVALKPGETSVEARVEFAPTALGPVTRALQISGAGGVQGNADLTGTGIDLTAILLLDVSGSMDAHHATGAWSAPETEQRLWLAKQAGKQLFKAYQDLTSEAAKFGLYTFPHPDSPTTASSSDWVGVAPADSLLGGPIGIALGPWSTNGLKANGGTPMLHGLNRALGNLPSGDGTFARPILLLLSDGAHNTPPPSTRPLDAVSGFKAKKARIYAVGFGEAGQSEVDHGLLTQLSTDTEGAYLPAIPSYTISIKKAFRDALRSWLDLRSVEDPQGTITASQSRTHQVCLDHKAYQALFVVDWDEQRDNAISFTLETPLGTALTPSSAGVSFSKDTSYAMYVVSGEHIRGGNGAGLWKLNLTGSTSLPGSLAYEYSVMVQEVKPPKPKWGLAPGYVVEGVRALKFYAGEPWVVEIPVDPDLKAQIDQSETGIRAVLDAPTGSIGAFLATSRIEREWIFSKDGGIDLDNLSMTSAVRRADGGESFADSLPTGALKARALEKYAKRQFGNTRNSSESFRLRDDGEGGDREAGDNVYSVALPSSRYDGIHHLRLDLDLEPIRRGCSNFDMSLSAYVSVNLATAVIAENVQWSTVTRDLFFDPSVYATLQLGDAPPPGKVRRAAVFTAKDKYGNHLGPGQAVQIAFDAKNGELVGPVIDNWDGSYIQVVEYAAGTDPALTVTAGGFKSERLPLRAEESTAFPQWILWLLVAIVALLFVDFLIKKLGRSS